MRRFIRAKLEEIEKAVRSLDVAENVTDIGAARE
jgi:hypothetical protein